MRKQSMIALTVFCMLMGVAYVRPGNAGEIEQAANVSSPTADGAVAHRTVGSVSSPEKKAVRAAKLKARIKAIEEGRGHPRQGKKAAVPLEQQTVRGSGRIKAKMRASEESGKKATRKLHQWYSSIMEKARALTGRMSISKKDMETDENRKRERKMSFKERLKLELARQRERKAKR